LEKTSRSTHDASRERPEFLDLLFGRDEGAAMAVFSFRYKPLIFGRAGGLISGALESCSLRSCALSDLVGAPSHPPGGAATSFAAWSRIRGRNASACALAAAICCASSRRATSSLFLPASSSPFAAATANHMKAFERFCSMP